MPPWSWPFWIAASLAALLGVWLLHRALLADRARGRRRCPKCWYDMAGIPTLTCPECGREHRREKHLRRTRRHWRRAAAALFVIIIAAGLSLTPRVVVLGWKGAIPTWALLLVWDPLAPPSAFNDFVQSEMSVRYGNIPDMQAPINRFVWRKLARRWIAQEPAPSGHGRQLQRSAGFGILRDLDRHALPEYEFLRSEYLQPTRMFRGFESEEVLESLVSLTPPCLPAIRRMTADSSPRMRKIAASELIRAPNPDLTPFMVRLAHDPDVSVRLTVYGSMRDAGLRGVNLPPELAECLSRLESPELRSHQIDAAVAMGSAGAKPLGAHLTHQDALVRGDTARALARLGRDAEPATDQLLHACRNDTDPTVRRWSVLALGWVRTPRADVRQALIQSSFSDADELVRANAVEAMFVAASHDDYIKHAQLVLADEAPLVRRAATRFLLRLGTAAEPARDALERATKDPDEIVASDARASLQMLNAK